MKLRRAWNKYVPDSFRHNLFFVSASLGLFGGWLLGAAEFCDANASQTLRQVSLLQQEEQSDQALESKTKNDREIIVVTGITPPTDHEKFYTQAEHNYQTAKVLRGLGGSSLACAVGLGTVAAARQRRENQAATAASQTAMKKGLALYTERQRREVGARTQLPLVPYEAPEVTIDTVRGTIRGLSLSMGSSIADIEAMTMNMQADAESARQSQIRQDCLALSIAAIRQEHATIGDEMELGRQATLAGFAALRAELNLPPAPDIPFAENNLQAPRPSFTPALALL